MHMLPGPDLGPGPGPELDNIDTYTLMIYLIEDTFLLSRKVLKSLKLVLEMADTSVLLQVSGKQAPSLLGTASSDPDTFRTRVKSKR